MAKQRKGQPQPPPPVPLLGSVGFGALLLALFLAPIIGGTPAGALYGGDVSLNALRALVLVAGLCLSIAPPDNGGARGERLAISFSGSPIIRGGGRVLFLWPTFALTLLSLLLHSRFLTSPVLLFAMLPATLDWLCFALVFGLAASLSRNERALRLMTLALLAGAAWVALSGVWQYRELAMTGNRAERISATFFSPNFAAGFIALVLPIAAAWFVRARENLAVIGTGVAMALMAGVLVATGSRASVALAVVGLGIALILALLTGHGPVAQRLPWPRIGVLLVAILVVGYAFRGPLFSRVTGGNAATTGQAHSEQYRQWTWKGTLAMAKANPLLGTGPGTFPYRYPRYAPVAKTDLAHSSYLQVAAEQGFPALAAALAAVAVALLSALAALLCRRPRRQDSSADTDESDEIGMRRLLLCGLVGGLIAGAARSIFDSEWSLLGNALPFWAAAGMAAGVGIALTPPPPSPGAAGEGGEVSGLAVGEAGDANAHRLPLSRSAGRGGRGVRAALFVLLLIALILTLILLSGNAARDTALLAARSGTPPSGSLSAGWPPDPDLLSLSGNPDAAARIEPSGRRFFRLGRTYERQGDMEKAIAAFKMASRVDPNSLQTWRALAEARERAGDAEGAVADWRELIEKHEGPVGQVRAIPELPETFPAFAYAALARDAASRGEAAEALTLYEKAAGVIEDYSRTPPRYQQTEIMTAMISGANVEERRQEVRALYEQIIGEWADLLRKAGKATEAAALERRRDETLERLDRFVSVSGSPNGGG